MGLRRPASLVFLQRKSFQGAAGKITSGSGEALRNIVGNVEGDFHRRSLAREVRFVGGRPEGRPLHPEACGIRQVNSRQLKVESKSRKDGHLKPSCAFKRCLPAPRTSCRGRRLSS